MPLVSVIVPVYNVEQYIHTCLDSLVRQTYKNIEIIVVNDCSPGGVAGIINHLKKKHKNINLVDLKSNIGSFRARLEGFKCSRGDLVTFVDGDDFVASDYIEKLVARLVTTRVDVVMGEMVHYSEKDSSKKAPNLAKDISFDEVITGEGAALYELLRKNNFFWELCGKLYKRGVFERAAKEAAAIDRHIVMGDDTLMSVYLFYYCRSFARAEFAFYYYLINDNSITAKTTNPQKLAKIVDDMNYVLNAIETFLNNKGVYDKYNRSLTRIRNEQAAKYYVQVEDGVRGKQKKSLLALTRQLCRDESGLAKQIEARRYDVVTDIKDLQWRLESMNSIKVSAKKLASNIKRKMKELVRVYGER